MKDWQCNEVDFYLLIVGGNFKTHSFKYDHCLFRFITDQKLTRCLSQLCWFLLSAADAALPRSCTSSHRRPSTNPSPVVASLPRISHLRPPCPPRARAANPSRSSLCIISVTDMASFRSCLFANTNQKYQLLPSLSIIIMFK